MTKVRDPRSPPGKTHFIDAPIKIYKNLWLDPMKQAWVPFTSRDTGPGCGEGRNAQRFWVQEWSQAWHRKHGHTRDSKQIWDGKPQLEAMIAQAAEDEAI